MARRIERPAVAAAALAACLAWVGPTPAQDKAPPAQTQQLEKPRAQDAAPAKPRDEKSKLADPNSLEELLAQALKNNPDVRVAESKVRQADAELNRARMQVTQRVASLHRQLDTQRGLVTSAEEHFRRTKATQGAGGAAAGELSQAQDVLAAAKAKLADLQAEVGYLTGKAQAAASRPEGTLDITALKDWIEVTNQLDYIVVEGQLRRDPVKPSLSWESSVILSDPIKSLALVRDAAVLGTDADKLRKSLDRTVAFQFNQTPLPKVLESLENTTGVSFLVSFKETNMPPVDVSLKTEVPLGAALQALEDLIPGLRFTVRDYGVLVTVGNRIPDGGVRVHDFWKHKPAEKKAEEKPAEPKK